LGSNIRDFPYLSHGPYLGKRISLWQSGFWKCVRKAAYISKWLTDKEVFYGKDNKEENEGRKGKDPLRLYLYNLREGHENSLPSVLAYQGGQGVCVRILRRFHRRSSACMFANVGRDEIRLQELRKSYTVQRRSLPARGD
jgi:hypothetical protein